MSQHALALTIKVMVLNLHFMSSSLPVAYKSGYIQLPMEMRLKKGQKKVIFRYALDFASMLA